MHGHGDPRLDQVDSFRGPERVEMPRPQRHSPAPYRQERDIHRPQAGHAVVEIRVAGDVDPLFGLEDMTDCWGVGTVCEPRSPTVSGMVGGHGRDGQVAVFEALADAEFLDVRKALPPEPRPCAPRYDDVGVADQPQRGQMEVVTVLVGDQDKIDTGPRGRSERRDDSDQRADAGREDWIREHNSATDLDPNCRMAKKTHMSSIGSSQAGRTLERRS